MNFDSIRNYYEHLVINYLMESAVPAHKLENEDLIEDIACLALNQLPARYIRHEVDMSFFLTTRDRTEMRERVIEAVESAVISVKKQYA